MAFTVDAGLALLSPRFSFAGVLVQMQHSLERLALIRRTISANKRYALDLDVDMLRASCKQGVNLTYF